MSHAFAEQLDQLIRARYPLIYMVTWEEERARHLLSQLAGKQRKTLFEWSITDGLRRVTGDAESAAASNRRREALAVLNEILQTDASAIYVLKDFHTFMEAPEIVRQLRDLSYSLRTTRKTIVLLSPVYKMPPELEKAMVVVDMPLPSYEELELLFKQKVGRPDPSRSFRVKLTPQELDALIKAAQGLTLAEAESAFARAIVRDSVLDGDDIQAILDEKKQIVRKTEVLECYDVSENLAAVGGMDILKDWLTKRVRAFGEEARRYGLPQPRGVLLLGVQGCGKSLVAKTVAAAWRLPLLRMDMSRIFQGYIGSSEQNMRKALKIAESIAPAVLWIDEIEKAFAGVQGSGSSDAGTTARVIAAFLTWMQEKNAPVFVVATANDVSGLPPELMRKGRFDDIFFVDLPTQDERREIFAIHLRKLNRDPARFALDELAAAAEGFSGSEIEQAIISGLHDSFFANRELESGDVLASLRDSVPLSRTMSEKLAELRLWARDRARPVSSARRNTPDCA